tara:strand:+ start:202 stop:513 length:312 start_codon:yes stop_codon:yes gene_type:complete
MADEQTQDLFVERISNVAHANGVFRITLGINEDVNNVRPSIRLLVPANQLGPMLQGIANAAKNIGEQIQFKGADDAAPAPKSAAKAKKSSGKAKTGGKGKGKK